MQRSKQQWRDLIQAQADSNLSIKQFRLEENITASSFYKYKSTLKPTVTPPINATEMSPFSRVLPIQSTCKPLQHEIKLNVGNVELILDSNIDTSWLANLIGRLS